MSIFKIVNGQKYTLPAMIEYITRPSASHPDYVFATGTDKHNAALDAQFIQILFAKDKMPRKDYYQFITILSEQDASPDSLQRFCIYVPILHWVLSRWPDLPQPEFQVITAIHFDKEPIYHAHTIVPVYSARDGHHFPWDKQHFWLLRHIVNQALCYCHFTPIDDKRLNEYSSLPLLLANLSMSYTNTSTDKAITGY